MRREGWFSLDTVSVNSLLVSFGAQLLCISLDRHFVVLIYDAAFYITVVTIKIGHVKPRFIFVDPIVLPSPIGR